MKTLWYINQELQQSYTRDVSGQVKSKVWNNSLNYEYDGEILQAT